VYLLVVAKLEGIVFFNSYNIVGHFLSILWEDDN